MNLTLASRKLPEMGLHAWICVLRRPQPQTVTLGQNEGQEVVRRTRLFSQSAGTIS